MPRNEREPERVVVPVVAEEAHVEKRVIPRGGVRVQKSVDEVVQHVDVALTKDDVDVERRVINRVFDERPEARVGDGVTVVPVVEEIVQTRFLVKEEVRLTRRRTHGRAVADVPLKRERAVVTPIAFGAPVRAALKKTEIRISQTGRNEMDPSYQSPRTSPPNASKVAVVENRTSAAHGTSLRARSFPTGVLLLLVVLAIALIALIAAIF